MRERVEKGRRMNTVFPIEFYTAFLDYCQARGDVEFWTYRQLPFDDDWDVGARYPAERARWAAMRNPNKVHLILQHDMDLDPPATMRMIAAERTRGVRSVVHCFPQRFDRATWLESQDWQLDAAYRPAWDKLRKAAADGWEIGYHHNAFELANWRPEMVRDMFADQLAILRTHVGAVETFSPHGGARGPGGESNVHHCPSPARCQALGVRWVANGTYITLNGNWSDGGITNPAHRLWPKNRDPRDFVAGWRSGQRYRMLWHPQYYGKRFEKLSHWEGVRWYDEVCRNPETAWENL